MATLPDYGIVVKQRQPKSGCIPTGIEWMLKYLKIKGIDFSDFQERYDLIYRGEGQNTGWDVARLIMADYPEISIGHKDFPQDSGKEKIKFIRQLIDKGRPVLISIALSPKGGWHIVPVVEIDDNEMVVLWMDEDTIKQQKKVWKCSEIEDRHNNWAGGTDLVYIEQGD